MYISILVKMGVGAVVDQWLKCQPGARFYFIVKKIVSH